MDKKNDLNFLNQFIDAEKRDAAFFGVLNLWPELNDNGIRWVPEDENSKASRLRLEKSSIAFGKTVEWILNNLRHSTRINHYRSSYGMKHIAERECGYISNGLFIAAMIYCDFKAKKTKNGLNCKFTVLESSVRGAERRLNTKLP